MGFAKYFIRMLLIWAIGGIVSMLSIYFFINRAIVVNPPSKSIISVGIVTCVYILSSIIGWFYLKKRNS